MELKDGLKIKVTAKFEVDPVTVQTCVNLLGIYGRSRGLEGMVIRFHEDGCEVEEVADEYIMAKLIDTARMQC